LLPDSPTNAMCRSDGMNQLHRNAGGDTVHPRDERLVNLKCPIGDGLGVLACLVSFTKFSNDPSDEQGPLDKRGVLAGIVLHALGDQCFLFGHLHDRGAHFLTKFTTGEKPAASIDDLKRPVLGSADKYRNLLPVLTDRRYELLEAIARIDTIHDR